MDRPDSLRTGLIAAGVVAAALAAGATGVALADSSSPTSSTTATTPDKGDARPGPPDGGRRGGHGPGMLGGFGALHGEFVVPDGDDGFQTMVTQHGEATAVSKTKITVKSEDGFTATYTVTEDTLVNAARDGIDTIDEGADVNVVATKDDGTSTALRIGDRSAREQMRERFGLKGSPEEG